MKKIPTSLLLVASTTCVLIVIVINQFLASPLNAIVEHESFPDTSSFDQSTGTAINSTINNLQFISTIKHDESPNENIVVFDNQGNGGIIVKENTEFRTFAGLKLDRSPIAVISDDISNDQKADLISLLPPEWITTKSWRRARIIEVGSDYIITDQLIRKNILAQSTIIGTDGHQYTIKSNTGPTDPSPRNAIYLDKQISPVENPTLEDYRNMFTVGQYISYLMPIKAISRNLDLVVSHNLGANNFANLDCKPYIPRDIGTPTSLALGQFSGDQNVDLSLITHTSEELTSSNVTTAYNTDTHTLTFTIAVPANQIRDRNLVGSYISFSSSPHKLIPIRQATGTQLIVDIVLPSTGEGSEAFQTALLPGDIFWLTTNTDESKVDLIYQGNGQGCFSFTGSLKGSILEQSFGKIPLPDANEETDIARSVLTDLNANWLPIDSMAGRVIKIGSAEYTIEHNDQYHAYLSPNDGNISNTVMDLIHENTVTNYEILPISPIPTSSEETTTKVVSLVMDIPTSIQALIGGTGLLAGKPQVRAIDIDQDGDKDIIYLNANRIFLKLNNEISS